MLQTLKPPNQELMPSSPSMALPVSFALSCTCIVCMIEKKHWEPGEEETLNLGASPCAFHVLSVSREAARQLNVESVFVVQPGPRPTVAAAGKAQPPDPTTSGLSAPETGRTSQVPNSFPPQAPEAPCFLSL